MRQKDKARLGAALDKLTDRFGYGSLAAASDAAGFIEMVMERLDQADGMKAQLKRLRALLVCLDVTEDPDYAQHVCQLVYCHEIHEEPCGNCASCKAFEETGSSFAPSNEEEKQEHPDP